MSQVVRRSPPSRRQQEDSEKNIAAEFRWLAQYLQYTMDTGGDNAMASKSDGFVSRGLTQLER